MTAADIALWLFICMVGSFGAILARRTTASSRFRAQIPQGLDRVKRVLFVIAHPDDETMFFAPSIFALRAETSVELFLLCLSTGNSAGLGSIRRQELVAAARKLGFPAENVHVQDHS